VAPYLPVFPVLSIFIAFARLRIRYRGFLFWMTNYATKKAFTK